MNSIKFHKTTTIGYIAGVVSDGNSSSITWLIREHEGMFQVYHSSDNGRSVKLIPRIDVDSDKNCYHETLKSAKEWIEDQLCLKEWCSVCGEESRIKEKMEIQTCEHCGSKLMPCSLCDECIDCPFNCPCDNSSEE